LFHISLSASECEELRRRTHEPGGRPAVRDRLEMIRLCDAGWSVPHIAHHLGFHEQSVRRYVKAFLADGFDGLAPRPHPGRPPRVTVADLEAVEARIDQSDRTWTTPQLVEWLDAERGVRVCAEHLGRLLRRRGFRWKRTKQSIAHKQRNPKLRRAAERELVALKKSGREGHD
jgi:transposase